MIFQVASGGLRSGGGAQKENQAYLQISQRIRIRFTKIVLLRAATAMSINLNYRMLNLMLIRLRYGSSTEFEGSCLRGVLSRIFLDIYA